MLVSQRLKPNAAENVVHHQILWHSIKDLLGVASSIPSQGGFISFFTKKGGKAFYSSTVKPNSHPELIAWHGKLSLLAVGWSTGAVGLIEPNRRQENTYTQVNFAKIKCLSWSHDNLTLVAVDINCRIHVFKHGIQHGANELALFHETNISDESPTYLLINLLDRNIFADGTKTELQNTEKLNGILPESDENANDGDTLTKLLNKHRRFINYEERKSLQPITVNAKRYSIAFIATQKGTLYALDMEAGGDAHRIFQADNEILQILSVPNKFYLLLITRGVMFYQLSVDNRLAIDRIKVKLTGRPENFAMVHINDETIAFCYGEAELRLWDLCNEDSVVLSLAADKGYVASDRIVALSYSAKKACISGFTESGKIASWRSHQRPTVRRFDVSIRDCWRLQNPIQLTSEKIQQAAWSPVSACLAVCTKNTVEIFVAQGVAFFVDVEYAVIQIDAQMLSLIRIMDPSETVDLRLHSSIKGFFLAGNNLLLWDAAKIQLDEIVFTEDSPLSIQSKSSFELSAEPVSAAIYHNNRILMIEKDRINVKTIQGTLKKSIKFRDAEGLPMLLDLNGNWLCVATSKAFLFIYDMNDENPKLIFHSTKLSYLTVQSWEKFVSVKVNSSGNRVSFTVQEYDNVQQKLYVWETETDSICYFSFPDGMTDQQLQELDTSSRQETTKRRPKTTAAKRLEQEISHYKLAHHAPANHFWDKNDARFLVCEAKLLELDKNKNSSMLLTMFVTTEQGIQMHDLQMSPSAAEALISVNVPYLFFLKNPEMDEQDDTSTEHSVSRLILRRTLREFVDVDVNDKQAVDAMLNFSYYLCIGQMDNAFKAIKYIKNESVWEHMAQMCVKTRRIDVARVCLGHMQNLRAARALNNSIAAGDSVDLQAARLAIELNMIDEAIAIFASLGRYDLLNRVYQAQGQWEKAFEVASKHDRIHLRHTHYNYARFLESVGAIESAIENYELSNRHHFEVPRMLYDELKALDFYINQKAQPELYKWWAQYLESINDMDTAKNFYGLAHDYLSVVRILCYNNSVDEAIDIVNRSGDRAAAFHLANYFEANDRSHLAVQYFGKAGAYGTAIRLAMRNDMTDKLANLALMAHDGELIKVAQYYENLPEHADKAIMLYHKAGMIGRALDLAFRAEQLSALDLIAQDLNANSDPRVLERAAEFFANNQQHHTAVQLLAYAKNYAEAVALCIRKKVLITEELDKLLTPPKTANTGESNRAHLLEEIAKCCLQQGNYHFAAKKFTQAGNKVEAMRALLKSGDTERIVLFANTARSKDIYKMAGNYLQTLNWKEDAQLMHHVENFYAKAGALDSLAGFYEACAQVEIDDYHDYDKALAAYNEVARCLAKWAQTDTTSETMSTSTRRNSRVTVEGKQAQVHATIEKIRKFLSAKELYETNPGEALRILSDMTMEEGINEIIRLGDIFAIIIMHNVQRHNFQKAYQIIEQCAGPTMRVDMNQFLNRSTVERIYTEVGVAPSSGHAEDGVSETGGAGGDVEYSHFMRRQMAAASQR